MVYTDGTYLIADSARELELFVKQNKLPREHLNSASYFPYYLIPKDYLYRVIENGGKVISAKELREIGIRKYRDQQT
ncbi:MAG: hypothetical protein ACFB15_19840 [Cyclobacteriaceae bacterium]